jgi:signal transduction histidine kinase
MRRTNMSQRLRRTLFLYSLSAMLVLGASISVATILPLYHRLQAAEEKRVLHAARVRALAVAEWLRRAKDLARQITSRTKIRHKLEAYNRGEATLADLVSFTIPKLRDAMSLSREVLGITRLDHRGRLVIQCGRPVPRKHWPLPRPDSNRIQVSVPFQVGHRLGIAIGAPILNRRGQRVGVDLVLLDTVLLRRLVTDYAGLGKGGDVHLGYLHQGRAFSLFPKGSSGIGGYRPAPQPLPPGAGLGRVIRGRFGLTASGRTIFAKARVAESNWVVVVSIPGSELYAPVNRLLSLILFLAALLTIFSLGGLWLLLRPLAGRLLIHASELEAEIDAKTRALKAELGERRRVEAALSKAHDELEARVKDRTAELASSHQARKDLSKRLIDLLEGIRRDVAMNLHDHAGQVLITLKMDLETALKSSGPDSDRLLAQAIHKVDTVLNEIKSITRGLRPDMLDYVGLVPSLRALFDECQSSAGIRIKFFHGQVSRRFDRQKEMALYRIAQEAVTNAIKHAQASEIHVNLMQRDGVVTLGVEDDGVGFDLAKVMSRSVVQGSLGLTLMKERMVQLGGELSLESRPGGGTYILAEVAL